MWSPQCLETPPFLRGSLKHKHSLERAGIHYSHPCWPANSWKWGFLICFDYLKEKIMPVKT